jgi:hypothetical protein
VKKEGWYACGVIAVGLIVMGSISASNEAKDRETAAQEEIDDREAVAEFGDPQSAEPESTMPSSYTDQGSGVGVRFVTEACDYGDCKHLEVYTEYGCSTLYVEANVLDRDKRVIGYSNDLLGSVKAGQTAVATLQITEAAADSVALAEVSCY